MSAVCTGEGLPAERLQTGTWPNSDLAVDAALI